MLRTLDEASRLIACAEPEFIAVVEAAVLGDGVVAIVLDGYQHEFTRDLCLACLWYALSRGLRVQVSAREAAACGGSADATASD